MSDFHSFELRTLEGEPLPLSTFKGKVVLVVNVASKCGLTPQYAALETLYKSHADRGFSVLGLPCNQFGGQEPGSAEDIQRFCSLNYGVSFPMGEKLEVNGEGRHPLYQWLVGEGEPISWNFEKFLIGRDGHILARFSPRIAPDAPEVIQAVERAIEG